MISVENTRRIVRAVLVGNIKAVKTISVENIKNSKNHFSRNRAKQ
jgi:hypothetical protein